MVVFQIHVARGALVCVSACLDSVPDEVTSRDAAVEEADDLRMHRQLESDAPMAKRASESDSFIARRRRAQVRSKVGVKKERIAQKELGRLHQRQGEWIRQAAVGAVQLEEINLGMVKETWKGAWSAFTRRSKDCGP